MSELRVLAPDGVPEVGPGDDLAALLLSALSPPGSLADGDVVLVTSKVVAKAEGRVVDGTREELLDAETVRVVARRGQTSIVRTRHGLVLAAAGIDASNVAPGRVVLLPVDPDASARRLRGELHRRAGVVVGVVVTDTAGRAWRTGQTDIAVGAAGLRVLEAYAGRRDPHGNELQVTEPAVADELAGAAELVSGKLGGRPFAVVRGVAHLVLPASDDGPGAAALVRPEGGDLFGYGAREAVVAAVAAGLGEGRDPVFGSPAGPDEVADAVRRALGERVRVGPGPGSVTGPVSGPAGLVVELVVETPAALVAAVAAVAAAYGWESGSPPRDAPDGLVRLGFRAATP